MIDGSRAVLSNVRPIASLAFRWPKEEEHFQRGWEFVAAIQGQRFEVRYALGVRQVYGRRRVHAATWFGGEVAVGGVETDDYGRTRSLISRLKRLDRKLVRGESELPSGYEGFEIVSHRAEIDALHSPRALAVKIHESDLAAWATHAFLRRSLRRESRWPRGAAGGVPGTLLPVRADRQAVVARLL